MNGWEDVWTVDSPHHNTPRTPRMHGNMDEERATRQATTHRIEEFGVAEKGAVGEGEGGDARGAQAGEGDEGGCGVFCGFIGGCQTERGWMGSLLVG